MKIRRVRILMSKGWCKVVCFVSFSLLSIVCNHASAQKAGDVISGIITDDEGPLMYVNVCERDSLNRIVAHAVTDIEGRFAFRLVNPENTIDFTYIGYERVILPIDKMYYEIKMEQSQYMDEIISLSDKPVLRTIDMSQYSNDSLEYVDDALTGKVAGFDILFQSGDLAYGPPVRALMKKIDGADVSKPLVVLDSEIREIDDAKLESFVFEDFFSRKSLAGLLGVRKGSLKAVRFVENTKATAIWGFRGFYGVLEVLTKKQYRTYKKEGKLEDDWQILK